MQQIGEQFQFLLDIQGFKPFQNPIFSPLQEIFGESESLQILQLDKHFSKISNSQPITSDDSCRPESLKTSQSIFHNCQKSLIKHLTRCLNFPITNILREEKMANLRDTLKFNLKNLLNVFELCVKGKNKSLSKQLLKLIYQEGAEYSENIKLLETSNIRRLIQACHPQDMSEAKSILRAYTLEKLQKFQSQYIHHHDPNRRFVNERYLQVFMNQLKEGKVSLRVSKHDKEWISQFKNF